MSRRHADVVEVRRRDDAPEQFLWRDRLYCVREVLAHWIESGAWWRSVPEVGAAVGATMPVDGEREFWRVAADAGRAGTPGVYDLCFDWSAGRWQLTAVLD